MEGDREFATYLKDHLAGSTGGVSLAQRMADTAQDGTAGFQEGEARQLAKIAEEIKAAEKHNSSPLSCGDELPSVVGANGTGSAS